MSKRFKLSCAADLTALAAFRTFIDSACQEAGIGSGIAMELKLAVDEACTNIIEHGYAGMNPGSIVVALAFDEGQIKVEITDFGHPFEPYQPEVPDARAIMDDQESGGFGLHIIYQSMDRIEYRASPLGNTLVFTKWLLLHRGKT